MPWKTVIKWFHYALTAVLLIVVIGFVMLNADRDLFQKFLLAENCFEKYDEWCC